jgi:hypothetical protein
MSPSAPNNVMAAMSQGLKRIESDMPVGSF